VAIDSDKPVYTQSLNVKVWVGSFYLVEILGSSLEFQCFHNYNFKLCDRSIECESSVEH
jgi:hypothetical protein